MESISKLHPQTPIPSTLTSPRFPNKPHFSSRFLQMHKRQTRLHSLPTELSSSALFLAATTAPKSADISLLLPTSAVMLAMYYFANFIVPDLIMKDLQAKEGDDENSPDDGQEK